MNLFLQFKQIDQILKKRGGKILIASHENPDADAIASVLSLNYFLKKKNFKTSPFLPNLPSRSFSFLPYFDQIQYQLDFFDFDLIFALDYGDYQRLKLPQDLPEKKLVTIDHHLQSDQRGIIKIIQPEFSSTCEILYLFLKKEIEINKDLATLLLCGIVSDSGGFSHFSTSPQTLKIASRLLSAGAPLSKITRQTLTLQKPRAISRIWGRALSRIKTDPAGFSYSWISKKDLEDCQALPSDLEGISSVISTISPAQFSIFLIEKEKGKVEGSLRSELYKGRNVALLAQALGGGGHSYAAGFRMEGTLTQALKKIKDLIK